MTKKITTPGNTKIFTLAKRDFYHINA
jgi:hypothetical protein